MPALLFTTLIIHDDLAFLPNKDSRNCAGSQSGLVCLNHHRDCQGDELWIQSNETDRAIYVLRRQRRLLTGGGISAMGLKTENWQGSSRRDLSVLGQQLASSSEDCIRRQVGVLRPISPPQTMRSFEPRRHIRHARRSDFGIRSEAWAC